MPHTSSNPTFRLVLDPATYVVERLDPGIAVELPAGSIAALMRRGDELTRIRVEERDEAVGAGVLEREGGWRALVIDASFDFEAVGVLAALSRELAATGVPLLAISTWATDVLLVGGKRLEVAIGALEAAGHVVVR